MVYNKVAKLKHIMFVGTGSDVGKSIIATAFCRIFKQDGYNPAPFKAQNMALNSYVTSDGLEIGRAQATQAEAAKIACSTDMNPILLKPNSNQTSQIVLNGKPIGNRSAIEYFKNNLEETEFLRSQVHKAFDRLSKKYNPIVIEGAGSVSELNLVKKDFVNMNMAQYANACTILVADIDKGGVFAAVYGSIMLLPPEQRTLIKGVIINKFQGDIRLFEEGKNILEKLTNVPVLGVIPVFKNIYIEQEDSVALSKKNTTACSHKINIAVIAHKGLSNYTDFDRLEQHDDVNLYYTNNKKEVEKADIIILPGTKTTLKDLHELNKSGLSDVIKKCHKQGKTVLGICGGYQMMGQKVVDNLHIEGGLTCIEGLNILPITTEILGEKVTKQVKFTFLPTKKACEGYEIHMGKTTILESNAVKYLNKNEIEYEGVFLNSHTMGTYIHGILDNSTVIGYLLKPYINKKDEKTNNETHKSFKEKQYNVLADYVRQYVFVDKIYSIMK